MQVPEELVCPITHAVFRNPVITAVGTVYEERAIRQHLQHNQTDPLTNQKIEDAKLTPVFVLRSKAKQYATSTAARCLDRVLDPECHDPATYLRRACDVCEEAGALLCPTANHVPSEDNWCMCATASVAASQPNTVCLRYSTNMPCDLRRNFSIPKSGASVSEPLPFHREHCSTKYTASVVW